MEIVLYGILGTGELGEARSMSDDLMLSSKEDRNDQELPMKKLWVLGIGIVSAAIMVAVVGTMLFGVQFMNASSKGALQMIHREISIGASKERVRAVYADNLTDRTHLKTDLFENTWVVGMPFELGATDPVLYVQFDSSSQVSAVAMRSSDGIYGEPPMGLEDKGIFFSPSNVPDSRR